MEQTAEGQAQEGYETGIPSDRFDIQSMKDVCKCVSLDIDAGRKYEHSPKTRLLAADEPCNICKQGIATSVDTILAVIIA